MCAYLREFPQVRSASRSLSQGLIRKKGADLCPRPASAYPRAPLLHVVVEEKLIWMRAQTQCVVLFAFGRDPHVEEVAREDVAFQEEVVIFLQAIQGFTKAAGHIRHFLQLFRRQF